MADGLSPVRCGRTLDRLPEPLHSCLFYGMMYHDFLFLPIECFTTTSQAHLFNKGVSPVRLRRRLPLSRTTCLSASAVMGIWKSCDFTKSSVSLTLSLCETSDDKNRSKNEPINHLCNICILQPFLRFLRLINLCSLISEGAPLSGLRAPSFHNHPASIHSLQIVLHLCLMLISEFHFFAHRTVLLNH